MMTAARSEAFVTATADAYTLLDRVNRDCREEFGAVADCWHRSIKQGGKLIFFGNGGSAAMAQHFAAECVVRLNKDRRPIAAIALSADTAVLTATGNDLGFHRVFSRQIEALARPEDCLVALSTSGRSENVVRGMQAGIVNECEVTAMLGATHEPDTIMETCTALRIPSTDTARVQEMHLLLGHAMIASLQKDLGL